MAQVNKLVVARTIYCVRFLYTLSTANMDPHALRVFTQAVLPKRHVTERYVPSIARSTVLCCIRHTSNIDGPWMGCVQLTEPASPLKAEATTPFVSTPLATSPLSSPAASSARPSRIAIHQRPPSECRRRHIDPTTVAYDVRLSACTSDRPPTS